jgi:N-acetylglucosamine malate deacetylase 1
MTTLFLFAHQDDELAAAPHLLRAIDTREQVTCLFLTDGASEVDAATRDRESIRALERFGVPLSNLTFLRTTRTIPDLQLVDHLDDALAAMTATLPNSIQKIWVTAWEGGHPDHDAAYLLARALMKRLGIAELRAFPIYHGEGTFGRWFRAFALTSGTKERVSITFKEGLAILRAALIYKSQWKTLLGLGPWLIVRALVRRSFEYRCGAQDQPLRRPHPGRLLYERMERTTWEIFSGKAAAFCATTVGVELHD